MLKTRSMSVRQSMVYLQKKGGGVGGRGQEEQVTTVWHFKADATSLFLLEENHKSAKESMRRL